MCVCACMCACAYVCISMHLSVLLHACVCAWNYVYGTDEGLEKTIMPSNQIV